MPLTGGQRLKQVLRRQGRVILAVDGLQPDVGHEVPWVLRDCFSGEILLARSLLSAATDDVASLLEEVRAGGCGKSASASRAWPPAGPWPWRRPRPEQRIKFIPTERIRSDNCAIIQLARPACSRRS